MQDSTASARTAISEVIDRHAIKAQNSAYDRDVCILAVGAARDAVSALPDSLSGDAYLDRAFETLADLAETYHDGDGTYTCGRGVIIAVMDDIACLRTPA